MQETSPMAHPHVVVRGRLQGEWVDVPGLGSPQPPVDIPADVGLKKERPAGYFRISNQIQTKSISDT